VIIPNGDVIMQENDLIYIVASPKNASVFFKKIGIDSHQVKNTMLVGGGVISYYLAKILIHMGIDVTIIEKDLERCNFLTDNLPEAMIIHGDGIDQNLLFEEGLQSVESFASLTNLDEENILLSLFAKSKSDAKIITKVHRITFDEVIHKLDIGSVICPKNVTAEYIIRYARDTQNSMGSNIETLYNIIENKAEAIEFKVTKNSNIIDKPLAEIPFKNNIIIACITHKNDIIIPKGQDMIREGDSIIVVTTNIRVKDVEDILV
jgi:trk system potassium uptake protein TrkA